MLRRNDAVTSGQIALHQPLVAQTHQNGFGPFIILGKTTSAIGLATDLLGAHPLFAIKLQKFKNHMLVRIHTVIVDHSRPFVEQYGGGAEPKIRRQPEAGDLKGRAFRSARCGRDVCLRLPPGHISASFADVWLLIPSVNL